ncbi:signal peptide peptidase SppA [Egibacter rhizosphaerae]|uniref:Signal peptide peptidase SppA n=1 Tax=Egibacter rhizosphaerae TaxID=1670831 RepID=A0A411YJY7_9ACTN|nr:signal peptide peptidase SppA [Egibacter rhizosphaerae]QBI21518.1 signal peptide peptidase SppA [Egibacter rhizosphaerae]
MPVSRLRARVRPPRVLALDLSQPVTDAPPGGLVGRLSGPKRPQLRDVLEVLEAAAADPRVRVLHARVDQPAASWAHAEELREAVAAFRRSGKPALAHAQSFGEAGDGTLSYFVAAAFDEVWLQPSGEVGLVGVAREERFLADMLDKLDVRPELDRRHEYKTAANVATHREFTDAHREFADRMVESHYEHLVAGVGGDRSLSHEAVTALVDRAPIAAEEARDAGLVDRLAYRDEVVAESKQRAGEGAQVTTLAAYRSLVRRRQLRPGRRTTVALVHGHGAIQAGRNRRSMMGPVMGSDTVTLGFQQAIRDKKVRAICFRVDSPGGSAVASDAVWRAVARAREAGKPVVVSMGSVAGSGGYWVAMGADRIVAAHGTLTGSIGVVSGKFVLRGLRERLGITSDAVERGAHARMFSTEQSFSDDEWEQVQAFLDRVYDEFVRKVAEGRAMSPEEVHEHARGRVWTGADAAERGLVDRLGGYRAAFATVRQLVGLPTDARLRVRVLPRQSLAERLGIKQSDFDDARAVARELGAALRGAGLDAGVVRMSGDAARD